jgi:phenylacetate-CoA ligase
MGMLHLISRALLNMYRPQRLQLYKKLVQSQWLDPDQQAGITRSKLSELLRDACLHVPYYRELARERGLEVANLAADDLVHFPLTDKALLQDRPERFLDERVDQATLVPNFTGGSSGSPFRFFSDRRCLEERKAADLRGRAWAGWEPGQKQAFLWAHPRDNTAAVSLRNTVLATLVHRTRTLNAYNMDGPAIEAFRQELAAFRPAILLGFSSSLAFLAGYLVEKGLSLPAPRGILSSAETLTAEHRQIIEKCFPCPLLNRYGSREFGTIAQQCQPDGGLHILTDQVHVEVLLPDGSPAAPGQRGEVVVTDLLNRAMPFIRYRTGDLAVPAAEYCDCGRGFPMLESVEGRTSELLVGANGKFYSCLGPRFFGHDIVGVARMQVIQEELERVHLKIVRGQDWDPANEEKFRTRLKELLGSVSVEFEYLEDIPPSASGKFTFTISKVSPFGR